VKKCCQFRCINCRRNVQVQGRKPGGKFGGDDDRLLSGQNFLLAKLAVLKHLTVEDKNKNVYIITGQLKLKHICAIFGGYNLLP